MEGMMLRKLNEMIDKFFYTIFVAYFPLLLAVLLIASIGAIIIGLAFE
jgi:hypothetical protein